MSNVLVHDTTMVGTNEKTQNRQYAINKLNQLIKKIEYIRDNQLDEELEHKFFNLMCLMTEWETKSIYMGRHIETVQQRKELQRDKKKMGFSSDSE